MRPHANSARLETGGPAPPGPASTPARLVAATYNIRYAVGSRLISGGLLRRVGVSRPSRRPALVAGNIEAAARAFSGGALMPAADLLALQEADRGTLRAGGRHVAAELAAALRMAYARAYAPTPRDVEPEPKQWYLDFEERIAKGEEGDTGVALLSRLPVTDVSTVELPWSDCPWRPRLALSARVPFGRSGLHVLNVHIDPHAGIEEQLAQHEAVLASAEAASLPTLLLGDFNTLSKRAAVAVRAFLESRGFETPMPTGTGTWRAGPLRLHPDWIFVRGPRVVRWGVARPLSVSDHWPVWAELEAAG
ncbi:MAG TPA: endonuclease/exonuclease/phosphatase family protein [Pyrinomonadaceae bacterium]|nr:endonuclease/exonuclease/phosphatase family protein [Pyrinomonadaceae bacterium]